MQEIVDILKRNSSREVADIITGIIDNDVGVFGQILELSLKSVPPVNWRGVRALNIAADSNVQLTVPYIELIFENLSTVEHPAMKRCLLRLLSLGLGEEHRNIFSSVLDYSYSVLVAATEEISYRIYAMEVIYKIVVLEPELKDEFEIILEDLMQVETKASFYSKTRKVLKGLQKLNHN